MLGRRLVNTSPRVFLARENLLDMLREGCREVIVPQPVIEEIWGHGPDDPTVKAIQGISWIQIAPTPAIPPIVRPWDLGSAESAVVSLALGEAGSWAVIDDLEAARLRGEASYGTVDHQVDPSWEVGRDVKDHYGVTKFEPPIRPSDGDSLRPVAAFHTFTDIENIRNFPDVLRPGEEVVITEKLHGKNCRLGLIRVLGSTGETFEFMAGSSDIRRKEVDAKGRPSDFWRPMTENLRDLLRHLSGGARGAIVFGELYGSGIQDMAYGLSNGTRGFRAFDIAVDGKYLDHEDKVAVLQQFGVEMVPHLYRGPFSWEVVEEHTYGPTTLCAPELAGRFKGREGCVITPVKERFEGNLEGTGRVILKSISADYLARKGGTDDH